MRSLFVFADFDFLASPTEVGVLNYDRVRGNEVFSFVYREDWLARYGGISLGKDLFSASGLQYAPGGIFGCFSDALPDRWGRTLARKREAIEAQREKRSPKELSSFDYLISLDDYMRIGGFRFKESQDGPYINDNMDLRVPPFAGIRELATAVDMIEQSDEKGVLPKEQWLCQLLDPGTSLGGARPKSNILDTDGSMMVAKFPSRSDHYDVALWEHFSHVLAGRCGIHVAQTRVMDGVGQYHILLSRRFDRNASGQRIHYASALTHLGFKDGDGAAEGKGYLDIVDFIIRACPDTERSLEELYRRVAFNICMGNGDDHFRNHGFLLGPKGWVLSPAYDLNPSLGYEQSLMISETTNEASLAALLEAHDSYFIPKRRAESIIDEVRSQMKKWPALAKQVHIPSSEVAIFSDRLNKCL